MKLGTLLVRADASPQIGWGHVMRCLALAQAWQDLGGDCIFAMAEPVEALRTRFSSENIQIYVLSASPGSADDASELSKIAREHSARWIVVDGYDFDADYQSALKKAGHKLLAIDDYGHSGICVADLILDQNAGTDESFYASRAPGTNLLLGTRYTMLRREFKPWRNWKREIPPVARRILVTMGGSDPEDLTERAIDALDLIAVERLEATVLVGAASPPFSRLQAVASNAKRTIRVKIDSRNVPDVMAWADLAISASGSTCWEMCMLGLPAVIIDAAENQLPIAHELSRRRVAVHIPRSTASTENVGEVVNHLLTDPYVRTQMSLHARDLIDGHGADRVVAAIRTHGFRLRPVIQSDCRLLWQWANDPVVRAASFSSHEIAWEEHANWFARKILDNSSVFLMLEDGMLPVATIRTQATTMADADISVIVAPQFRGQGLAPLIFQRALEEVFAVTELQRVHAFIKPDNAASSRSFGNAGFVLLGTARVKEYDALHYIYERQREVAMSSLKRHDHAKEAASC